MITYTEARAIAAAAESEFRNFPFHTIQRQLCRALRDVADEVERLREIETWVLTYIGTAHISIEALATFPGDDESGEQESITAQPADRPIVSPVSSALAAMALEEAIAAGKRIEIPSLGIVLNEGKKPK